MEKPMSKFLLPIFALLFCALPGKTEEPARENVSRPVMFVSREKEGGDAAFDLFRATRRLRFHDPGVPRFLLTGPKRNWALGIGGYVQAKIEYDFDGIVNDIDFYPSLIIDGNPLRQFQMDVTTSTLFLKLVGNVGVLGPLIVYTSANWRGGGMTLELQNAYIQFLGFTLGYDTGTFLDLAAEPPTIDYAGPCGMTYYQTTLIRYERNLGKGFSAGIALEMPLVDVEANRHVSFLHQSLPDIPAYLQYAWNGGRSHVRLSGIYRNLAYTDLDNDHNACLHGWGAQASAVVAVGKPVQLFMQYAIGKGIGSLINDLSNLSVDAIPDSKTQSEMYLIPMSGWYVGMQYNITPSLFASATYSCSRLYTENGYEDDNSWGYKRGQYVVANLFWTVISDLQLGVEYLRGWRTDFADRTDRANRVNLSAKFSF